MNEDDTFNRLKRAPYRDVALIHGHFFSQLLNKSKSYNIHHIEKRIDKELRKHGWTLEEFDKASR
jgi:hypothetical protein